MTPYLKAALIGLIIWLAIAAAMIPSILVLVGYAV